MANSTISSGTIAGTEPTPLESFTFTIGDETTAQTVATDKYTFRMPYKFNVEEVRASCVTAPTGASLVGDINQNGSSILSTKLSIDATEKTSTTAATPAVISTAALSDDDEISVDIDQIGSTIAGAGYKVYMIGRRELEVAPVGDAEWASVTLLLDMEGADASTTFTDTSDIGASLTAVNNAQIDTDQKLYGNSSLLCDGTNDYIRVTDNSTEYTFGTDDFTVEFSVRFNSIPAAEIHLFSQRDGGSSSAFIIAIDAAGKLTHMVSGNVRTQGTTVLSTGVWYQISYSRVSGSGRLFLDGVQEGSTYADSTNYAVGEPTECVKICVNGFNNLSNFDGWMDELRITKGVGRYTTTYTPSTVAFPAFAE